MVSFHWQYHLLTVNATLDPQFYTVRKTLQNNDTNSLHWETRLEVDIFKKTDKTDIPSVSLDS